MSIQLSFGFAVPPEAEWQDSEIGALAEEILIQALRELADQRVTRATYDEIVAWLNLPTEDPFGFIFCCRAGGFDPDELRERIAHLLRKFPPPSVKTAAARQPDGPSLFDAA